MKRWLAVFLMIVPGLAGAQPVLDFRNDLAFQATIVNSFAAHIYRERLRKLKADGKLDLDQALLKRLRGTGTITEFTYWEWSHLKNIACGAATSCH